MRRMTLIADGEIVWFWRPDAGAQVSQIYPRGDGGKKARSPGRSRISRNTIAQGMPVVAGEPVVANACAFCCTRGRGCIGHPAFPVPSSSNEGGLSGQLGRKRAARTRMLVSPRCHVSSPCHAPRMRGIQYAAASRFKHKRLWNTGSPGRGRATTAESAAHSRLRSAVMLRACGASSTPRLLGSSTSVSGILDRPVKPDDDSGERGALITPNLTDNFWL
jgi:hypothetical protein